MKRKNRFMSLALSLALLLSLSIPASAADKDYTLGRTYTWSPYTSTDAFGGRTISGAK